MQSRLFLLSLVCALHEMQCHKLVVLSMQMWCRCRAPWCLSLQVCTVFAQLTVRGVYQGPHVFVVRLRDDAGQAMRGVRIQDNGPKVGPLSWQLLSHHPHAAVPSEHEGSARQDA